MIKETLSSRERVRLALDHQLTDRIPLAMVCSGINPPVDRTFDDLLQRKRRISLESFLRHILDIRYVNPAYIGPAFPPDTDIWGVRRKPVNFGLASYDEIVYYPLAWVKTPTDLEKHIWPDPDWFDYEALNASISAANRDGEHCLMISNGNIFETGWYMRGFERIFLDLVDNPELVHELFKRVTNFYIVYFTRLLQVADSRVDLVFTADDIGGQHGLLMSLGMWEQFIKPYHTRLNKAIHEFGVKVIYHSDGAVQKAVPGLIDMGIDILQALQFSADGMVPSELKNNYGDLLCFEGGVSVQSTLPAGTPEDVRNETEELINVLGKEGGYILGPSHAIQAGTPPENILAMFDTALNYYPF